MDQVGQINQIGQGTPEKKIQGSDDLASVARQIQRTGIEGLGSGWDDGEVKHTKIIKFQTEPKLKNE